MEDGSRLVVHHRCSNLEDHRPKKAIAFQSSLLWGQAVAKKATWEKINEVSELLIENKS